MVRQKGSKKTREELKESGSHRPGKNDFNLDAIASAGKPKPLRTLNSDEEKVWKTVAENFPPHILGGLDSAALTMLCGHVGLWLECTRKMQKERDTKEHYKLWTMAQGAANAASKMLIHFGMTPRARTEIRTSELTSGTKPTAETDPLMAMMDTRGQLN